MLEFFHVRTHASLAVSACLADAYEDQRRRNEDLGTYIKIIYRGTRLESMLRSFQDTHWNTFPINGGSILLTDDEYRQESSVSKYVVVGLEALAYELIKDISISLRCLYRVT